MESAALWFALTYYIVHISCRYPPEVSQQELSLRSPLSAEVVEVLQHS